MCLQIVFAACNPVGESRTKSPRAIDGVLDLRGWNFEEDGLVDLSGEYEFYWKTFLTPGSDLPGDTTTEMIYLDVPKSWNEAVVNSKMLGGAGYATYRLTILLDKIDGPLSLKFLDMGTAYSVFVDGNLLTSVGRPGENRESTIPRYDPRAVEFLPEGETVALMFHVANFHHRRGGAWEAIQLGTVPQISKAREKRLAFDLMLFGAIFIMAIYHLVFFVFRKKDKSSFYFGVFCLLIALRSLTTVERYFMRLVPDIYWEVFVKFEYLSYYLAVIVFARFLHFLFADDFSDRIFNTISIIGGIFALVVVFTPVRLFSQTLYYYNIFALICFVYGFYVITLGIIRKREGALIILTGLAVLFLTVINDMLDVHEIIRTGHLAHVGVFIFILSQASILSFRFSKMFKVVERQRRNLQQEINERKKTEADLKKSQKQLRELSAHLNSAMEKERALISREIHDDLGQLLSTLNMDVSWLENHLPARKELFQRTKHMSDLITKTVQRVRKISQKLRPSVLDNLGFYPAIKWQLNEFQKQSGIQCRLTMPSTPVLLIEPISNSLFRVFQEALTNIYRHADATEVEVAIAKLNGGLSMEIQDNGCGILESNINDPKSFGLTGLRERIRILNGKVDISGKSGAGTRIKVYIPILEEREKDAENFNSR